MSENITLNNLKEDLTFFNKMYDIVRLVDPINKCVLEYSEQISCKTDDVCYNYWKNGKICDNCISVRAYYNNNSFIKLEYKPEDIMMVTAIPMEADGLPVVLELLKNATDSIMIGLGEYKEGQLLKDFASNFNDMVIKDKLTQLYNRRFIDERLPADIVDATIKNIPLSIIFFDVDDLKFINDKYGHSVGDMVIKEVGNTVKNNIRADKDWAARYGGDEFLICLTNSTYDEAYNIAERIRKNIEKISVSNQNISIKFTISLGIYTMHGLKLTAEEIINLADEDMYKAKRSGKNNTI